MLRRSIIVGLFLLMISYLTPDSSEALEYGITGGYTHSYFGDEAKDDFDSRNSFQAGFYSALSLSSRFSLEVGVRYVKLGAEGPAIYRIGFDNGARNIQFDAIHRLDYVVLPIKIRFKSSLRVVSLVPSLAIGIVPALNLSAETEVTPSEAFPIEYFGFLNVPITRNIDNIKLTDISIVVAPALDFGISGHTLRFEAEWNFGLTIPFRGWKCVPPDESNSRELCKELYGLFNDDPFLIAGPAQLKNRSFMMTVSFVF